jgi:hypothetical protein
MKLSRWSLFLLTILPQSLSAALFSATEEPVMKPTVTKSYDAATLAKDFPPVLKTGNLKIVYDIAKAEKATGTVVYSRWATMALPGKMPEGKLAVEARADFFTYDSPAKNSVEWHLNFANVDLFAYYGSGLFAQDEMQVAEHPTLASLREALLRDKLSTLTAEGEKPTPILIRGVQRRVRIATDANAGEGRPNGLYGNNFGYGSADAVRRAALAIDPPTTSNIIAIEAPSYGTGEYTAEQIRFVLSTAYTGFRAARLESEGEPRPKVVIHTGFWGCGAYGGNRVLMASLQLLASRMAEVDQVVFHAGDEKGVGQFKEAEALVGELGAKTASVDEIVTRLMDKKFRWGVSDGN